MYYLGIDLGSSSVKLALIDRTSGRTIGRVQEPQTEMVIRSAQPGWATQSPLDWWRHVCAGISRLLAQGRVGAAEVAGIGIAYQMHGLVLLDQVGEPLQDAIIWCDSRAVGMGEELAGILGPEYCRNALLNEPGNFTASKLAWVRRYEPQLFDRARTFMLPGDYIAYRLSGRRATTSAGLSEGILWNFQKEQPAYEVFDALGGGRELIPDLVPVCGEQGRVDARGAEETGLREGTPVLYRAGDQPNNAFALGVLEPGESAATAGTSGVIYALTGEARTHELTRINSFAHVNHGLQDAARIGKLLCINGCGILYRWLREAFQIGSYAEMNQLASTIPPGSESLLLLPFGNGAERMLGNRSPGAQLVNLDLNRHTRAHVCRAALEGIAFSFRYGFHILQEEGLSLSRVRAGNDNLFQSEVFVQTVASLLQVEIECYATTGAVGAARACGWTTGEYGAYRQAMESERSQVVGPRADWIDPLGEAYFHWNQALQQRL